MPHIYSAFPILVTCLGRTMELTAVPVLLAIFLSFSIAPATPQETDKEGEFSYAIGSKTGPENWGKIHKNWFLCGSGRAQSPIDLSDQSVRISPSLSKLNRSYAPSNATLKNRGHDIMLRWEGDAGSISINGTRYILKQLHWHSPSEHSVNGNRFSLEIHMVHESAEKQIAVVSILFKSGRPDPFLAKMGPYIAKIAKSKVAEEKVGMVDPREIKRGSRKYYRYMGSLTTPPCSEGVVWTVIRKVRTVSRKQVKLLRVAIHDGSKMNARPIQQVNDRVIALYRPKKI